jgi:hypothetical protein
MNIERAFLGHVPYKIKRHREHRINTDKEQFNNTFCTSGSNYSCTLNISKNIPAFQVCKSKLKNLSYL